MLFSDAVERYIAARPSVRAQKTRQVHRSNVERIREWIGHDPTLAELDDERLGRYFAARGAQVAASTINSEAGSILAVIRWAARKRWCDDPDIQPPSRPRRLPKALTVAETVALVRTVDRLTGDDQGIPANVRWRAYLLTAINTAERIGAVRGLEWADIRGDWIVYRAEIRKAQTGDIARAILPVTQAALGELRSYGEPRPFAWLHKTHLYGRWRIICQLAGIGDDVTPHTLRRTAATHCHDAGKAQALLGHSNVRLTMRSYIDPTQQRRETPHEGLVQALAKPRRVWWRWGDASA